MAVKATYTNSWDNWGNMGSASTMLTMRYWANDGFLKHKFLFLPSGYHPEAGFLDKPELRSLLGPATGGLIGNRLYYTHYPSGYLIPYGILAKLGFENRFYYRFYSLLLSFASVVFLFGFFYLLTNKNIWLPSIAIFYYITSTTFLGYADSLNNTPTDDFFKTLILFLSAFAIKNNKQLKGKLKWFIWIFSGVQS